MKNLEARNLLMAISSMGDVKFDDIETALAIVENHEKLNNFEKNTKEALKKVAELTEEEVKIEKEFRKLERDRNSKEFQKFTTDNKKILESIDEKNKKFQKAFDDLMEKPFKISLTKIDKKNLPKSALTLSQIAALKLIFK